MINIFKFASTIVAVCLALCWGGQADSPDVISQKNLLLEKLDSIDMEKQIRKRKGQSLDELEKRALAIKDSITALKKNINLEGASNPHAAADRDKRPEWSGIFRWGGTFVPKNPLDWIVGIVAAIAIIAGIILCLGLFSIVKGAMDNKKKPLLKPSGTTEPLSLKKALPSTMVATSGTGGGRGDKNIESLRRRISEESKPEGDPNEGAAIQAGTQSVQGNSRAHDKDAGETAGGPTHVAAEPAAKLPSAELKKLIVAAALEGADAAEISKKFHIGADHVSLILRIAHQESDKNL